jgi:hypothetical protein
MSAVLSDPNAINLCSGTIPADSVGRLLTRKTELNLGRILFAISIVVFAFEYWGSGT